MEKSRKSGDMTSPFPDLKLFFVKTRLITSMNNSCASTDGQSHNLFKLTKIGGMQPNFLNIAAHLPEYRTTAQLLKYCNPSS